MRHLAKRREEALNDRAARQQELTHASGWIGTSTLVGFRVVVVFISCSGQLKLSENNVDPGAAMDHTSEGKTIGSQVTEVKVRETPLHAGDIDRRRVLCPKHRGPGRGRAFEFHLLILGPILLPRTCPHRSL
jgi:hypothetical protein